MMPFSRNLYFYHSSVSVLKSALNTGDKETTCLGNAVSSIFHTLKLFVVAYQVQLSVGDMKTIEFCFVFVMAFINNRLTVSDVLCLVQENDKLQFTCLH